MSAGGSAKVIIISLCANIGIAISKLAAALFTGSAALLAESVHSFADCGNQGLLLYGQKAAKLGVSKQYPMGRSKEGFFWSFVVALLLFSMGGVFSLYEGWHKISHPEPISYPWVGIGVLIIAVILESVSFYACLKEVRKENTFGSLGAWIRRTTSADLLVIFLEDFAALLGLVIALAALLVAWATNNSFFDGLGSMSIGILLIGVAIVLAREVKSLLIGEAPAFDYETAVGNLVNRFIPGGRILRFIALQVGTHEVQLSYKISPGHVTHVKELIDGINALEKTVREKFPEVVWQFVEPDFEA